MQEIDLVSGLNSLESCFLWAGKYFSKCAIAESRVMCDSWVASQIHWIRFFGNRTQAFQEILGGKKKVRVTGLMRCHSEALFRCPAEQSSVCRPALCLQWSHQPRSSGEPWLGIGVSECRIAVFFWGCWSLTPRPLRARSSGLCILISIYGSSSLLESYRYIGHVHRKEERENRTRTRNPASCYFFLFP